MSLRSGGFHVEKTGPDTRAVAIIGLLVFFGLSVISALFLLPGGDNSAVAAVVTRQEAPGMRKVTVFVPIKTIEAHKELSPALFRSEKWPELGLRDGYIQDLSSLQGTFSTSILLPGQPIYMAHVSRDRPLTVIHSEIPEGFRAVTIRVNATASVEGWARPNSRVDIHWITKVRGRQGMVTIVQNAKVLSVDRQVNSNNPDMKMPSTVTLLTATKDAQKVLLAQNSGQLSLSLRGDKDSGKADAGGTTTMDLLLGNSNPRRAETPRCKGTIATGGNKWCIGVDGSLTPLFSKKTKGIR